MYLLKYMIQTLKICSTFAAVLDGILNKKVPFRQIHKTKRNENY